MDIIRDDLAHHVDSSLDGDAAARETFLLDEGLEVLALYRAIGDADVRQMVRRLLTSFAGCQTPKQ